MESDLKYVPANIFLAIIIDVFTYVNYNLLLHLYIHIPILIFAV